MITILENNLGRYFYFPKQAPDPTVCTSQMPQVASSSHLHGAGPWTRDRSPTGGWPQQAGEGEVRLGWGSPPGSHRHCHIPVGCDTLGLFQEAAGLQVGGREGDWVGVPFQVLVRGGGGGAGGVRGVRERVAQALAF